MEEHAPRAAGPAAAVDPFIGTAPTALPEPVGLAATWWFPKPQIGNTHPGAAYPFGMVSACAYSGAYPTGYGRYGLATEGVPEEIRSRQEASGFTHFQQSGTGAIRKYYNYFRVTPMLQPLDALGTAYGLGDERAVPGYYAATLDSGVRAELVAGPKSVVHRYVFPRHEDARIVVDFSQGGLAIPHGETVPLRAHLELVAPGVAQGRIVVEGAPLSVHIECDALGWQQMLWYDRRLMRGGSRLDFDAIRPTTLRGFGLLWAGAAAPEAPVEVRIGFSLRGPEQARANLERDGGSGPGAFARVSGAARAAWDAHLGAVRVDADDAGRQTVFSTALYHSLVKPAFAPDESPFWPGHGAFAFDLCTLWDIYRTQLPLLALLFPDRAVELANALVTICEEEGNFPIGYRMARGADRFSRQGSALAHTFLAELCARGLPGLDWDRALVHLHHDLRRGYGEDFLLHGSAEPLSHTLDLAVGYWCAAQIARRVGDHHLAAELDEPATWWRNAFDPSTGLLRPSTYYEGGAWNYSFRLLPDMRSRIALAGGDAAFTRLLDRFFGFGASAVRQPGRRPGAPEMEAGYALGRFEGLNNEPDLDAPWAYHYAGRPDRTAEVVHAAVMNQFGTGPGGLPGNDDSGGLSSWYVWAALGLFPVAGQGIVLLGPPSFRSARLEVPGGGLSIETLGFRAPEPGGPVQYVQEARLDGRPLERTWTTSTELAAARSLQLRLGDRPGSWGVRERPPSGSVFLVPPG
ncbi:glycoside hydrolase domain-containing protein [Zafaria sp. Z1313]|uniref:glycoside hydrolase domain-containing protein n=1 Tax=Zafaria sp. Z1313 TaxID=3423202 RepID=UPI003D3021B3